MRKFSIFLFFVLPVLGSAQDVSSAAVAGVAFSDEQRVYVPHNTDDFWTLMDTRSQCLELNHKFDSFQLPDKSTSDNYIFSTGGKYGVLDKFGDTLFGFKYDSIVPFGVDFICLEGDNWLYCQDDSTYIKLDADDFHCDYPYVYTYRNGKTGILNMGLEIAPSKFDAIHPYECGTLMQDKIFRYYLAMDGGQYVLLNEARNSLLPEGTEQVQCYDQGIIQFFNETWQYYLPERDKIINPKGRDIVFYGQASYKIYTRDRSASSLYLDSGRIVFEGDYDDYFIISASELAVRKDGKIGMIDRTSGNELISPQFDRIELVHPAIGGISPLNESVFKYFRGDSCGLMSRNGAIQFDAIYSNILSTVNSDRFIVFNDHLCGVVDKTGKVILPVQYDYLIVTEDGIQIQHNERFGRAKLDGQLVIPVRYRRIDRHTGGTDEFPNQVNYVCQDFSRKWQLATKEGLVSQTKFDSYNFGNGNFKGYAGKDLLIYVLDEDGMVDEKQYYKDLRTVVVQQMDFQDLVFHNTWTTSYLEEHQLNGLFGLRYYTTYGLGAEPLYNHAKPNLFHGFMGEISHETLNFPFVEGIKLRGAGIYANMSLSAGELVNAKTLQTEAMIFNSSNSNVHAAMIDLNLNRVFETSESNPLNTMEMRDLPVLYSDSPLGSLKRFYLGGTAQVCNIDSADVSLYDYYRYINSLSVFSMDDQDAITILDARKGVRFEGSKQRIIERHYIDPDDGYARFKPHRTFEEFDFIENADYFYSRDELGKSSLTEYRSMKEEDRHSKKGILGYSIVETEYSTLIELKEQTTSAYTVHVDYPYFAFQPNERDIAYVSGRIFQKYDSTNFSLVTPKNEVLAKDALNLKYVNEDMFAVEDELGWYIIDWNGNKINDAHYVYPGSFEEGIMSVLTKNGYALIDKKGDVLIASSSALRHLIDTKYEFDDPNETIIKDAKTKQIDTLRSGEKYLGAEFIIQRIKPGKYAIRSFGDHEVSTLKSGKRPVLFGDKIYFTKGKSTSMMSQGSIVKYKKAEKLKVLTPEIGLIAGKKTDRLVNKKGELILEVDDATDISPDYKDALIITKDTSYLVNRDGEVFDYTSVPKERRTYLSTDEAKSTIFKEKGKFGIEKEGQILIPAIYPNLRSLNEKEYIFISHEKKSLFTNNLDEFITFRYDAVYPLSDEGFLVKVGRYFYNYSRDGERITPTANE